MRLPTLLLSAALGLVVFSGCDTFENRAKQKAGVVTQLDPKTRAKLERGIIEIGQTPDMVYLALGTPDDEYETTSSTHGKEKTWIYNDYHQEFAGNHETGYRRVLVYDKNAKGYAVYLEPVYTNVYVDRAEEKIRITFRDCKVAVIEQPKAP